MKGRKYGEGRKVGKNDKQEGKEGSERAVDPNVLRTFFKCFDYATKVSHMSSFQAL
jgi:hypothetical protein